jgi:hypothetical protein
VNNHVLICVACETLLREQTKLRELVSSLGTVEAPGDFEFRLRARLADQKRKVTQPFMLGNFPLGLRSSAVITILLLVGSALMFISFRNGSNAPLKADATNVQPNQRESVPVASKETVATNAPGAVSGSQIGKEGVLDASVNPSKAPAHPQAKRHGSNGTELASRRDSQRTRDLSSTSAAVLRRDQLAEAYAMSAFPIDAGYQSLKVSVDDGHGTSRTISLPTVSFGSQRSLSQGASPLMASARDAW